MRLLYGVIWVIAFTALCITAWAKDWNWFAKFLAVAGVVSGLIGMSADVCAILKRARMIRDVESTNEKPA